MKFQFDFDADEYATLMVALVFAEEMVNNPALQEKISYLRDTVVRGFRFVD